MTPKVMVVAEAGTGHLMRDLRRQNHSIWTPRGRNFTGDAQAREKKLIGRHSKYDRGDHLTCVAGFLPNPSQLSTKSFLTASTFKPNEFQGMSFANKS